MNIKTLVSVAALGAFGMAHADLLSLYNFNDASTTGTSAANAALLMSCDGGTLQSGTTLATNAAIANVVSFTGTITNAANSDPAGAALAIQGGTSQANNGKSLTMTTTASAGKSLTALTFSFAGQRTATGFNSYQLAYSINGGAFTNFNAAFDLNSSTAPGFGNGSTNVPTAIRSFNLSSLTGTISSIALRITFTGSTSSAGNLRVDNLQLNGRQIAATPEPASYAVLGLGAVALIRRRKRA
jgi:hypothetical protein